MKRCTTVVVLGLLLALAGPATSQTENPEQDKAKLYYQLGEKYFREANYRAALEEFRKAHKLVPTPIMLWNFGRCLEGLGKAKEAAKQYEEYLRLDPRTKNRTIIERRIQNLRKQAGQSAAPPAEKKSPEPVSKPRAPAAVTVEPEPDQGINIKQVMGWTAAGVAASTVGARPAHSAKATRTATRTAMVRVVAIVCRWPRFLTRRLPECRAKSAAWIVEVMLSIVLSLS